MSIPSIYSNFIAFGPTFLAKKGNRGFMMIELLISVLIMSAMSTLVISANSNMSARLQTDNLAHQVALSIREAQTRALSASAVGATNAGEVPGFGVYVNTMQNTIARPFSDTSTYTSVAYTALASSDSGPVVSLGQGYTIEGLSATPSTGGQGVGTGGVSIFFRRPRPDAQIFYSGSPTNPTPTTALRASQASIVIRSPKGYTKTVTVTATGQVSVQ